MTFINWFIGLSGKDRVFMFVMMICALGLLLLLSTAVVIVFTTAFYNAKYTVLQKFGALKKGNTTHEEKRT